MLASMVLPRVGAARPSAVCNSHVVARMSSARPAKAAISGFRTSHATVFANTKQRLVLRSAARQAVVTTAKASEPSKVKYPELTTLSVRTPMGDMTTLSNDGKPVVLHLLRRFG